MKKNIFKPILIIVIAVISFSINTMAQETGSATGSQLTGGGGNNWNKRALAVSLSTGNYCCKLTTNDFNDCTSAPNC